MFDNFRQGAIIASLAGGILFPVVFALGGGSVLWVLAGVPIGTLSGFAAFAWVWGSSPGRSRK